MEAKWEVQSMSTQEIRARTGERFAENCLPEPIKKAHDVLAVCCSSDVFPNVVGKSS
jgi:hypothetical protein